MKAIIKCYYWSKVPKMRELSWKQITAALGQEPQIVRANRTVNLSKAQAPSPCVYTLYTALLCQVPIGTIGISLLTFDYQKLLYRLFENKLSGKVHQTIMNHPILSIENAFSSQCFLLSERKIASILVDKDTKDFSIIHL